MKWFYNGKELYFPGNYLYSHRCLWIDAEGRIGVTDYLQEVLGDLYNPRFEDVEQLIGKEFKPREFFDEIIIETQVNVVQMVSPAHCKVLELNYLIIDDPNLMKNDPYGAGWILRVKAYSKKGLMRVSEFIEWLKTGYEVWNHEWI